MSVFCCPECLAPLLDTVNNLCCAQCGRHFPVCNGVPLLTRKCDYYYGHEVSQGVMQALLARSEQIGWKAALTEHSDSCGNFDFYNYSASEQRAGFKFLLDHFQNGVVLDYGCGSGANTLSLARNFSHVYATDLTPERAQFTRIRARQENLDNVTVFCSGDTAHIPLPDKSVDLIIVDGVLEWVPESRPGQPTQVQIAFLKELRRLIKETGHIFITIENRFGAGYFVGVREEHTRMRFVSLLPRRAADWYSQWVRGRPVRTYTYTRSGYRSLLSQAGLESVDFWGLLPSYRMMEKAIALDKKRMVEEALTDTSWKKRLRNRLVRPMLPWLVGSFGIQAGNVRARSFVEDLVSHVSESYLPGREIEILRFQQNSSGIVHVELAALGERFRLELPLYPGAERRIDASVRNVRELAEMEEGSLNELRVETPIAWHDYRGQSFLLQREPRGRAVNDQMSSAARLRLIRGASEYLVHLCQATRRPAGSWQEILRQKAQEYGLSLAEEYRRRGLPGGMEQDVLEIVDALEHAAPDTPGFLCSIHGNFRPSNLLVSEQNGTAITTVMNWDCFEPRSLPFLDLFQLITVRGPSTAWGARLVQLFTSMQAQTPDTSIVRDYAQQVGIDQELAPQFLIVYWLRQCLLRMRSDSPQLAKILQEGIFVPLDYLRAKRWSTAGPPLETELQVKK